MEQLEQRQRTIYIKNWIIDAGIGIHAHELNKKQKIRLNITFYQDDSVPFTSKKISDVVDYEVHKNKIQALIDSKHEALVETLADRIARLCLEDKLVAGVAVELEKLEILPGLESCGVVIEREQGDY